MWNYTITKWYFDIKKRIKNEKSKSFEKNKSQLKGLNNMVWNEYSLIKMKKNKRSKIKKVKKINKKQMKKGRTVL